MSLKCSIIWIDWANHSTHYLWSIYVNTYSCFCNT